MPTEVPETDVQVNFIILYFTNQNQQLAGIKNVINLATAQNRADILMRATCLTETTYLVFRLKLRYSQ